MKNISRRRKIALCISLIALEVVLYMCVNYYFQIEKNKRPYTSSIEFVPTIDCAEIFNKNPGKAFEITFDIRSEKPGKVLVYQQNGSSARYSFYEYVDVTEEYQTMQIVVEPILADENEEKSILAFYGEYGTGIIPEVKNISINVKENCVIE